MDGGDRLSETPEMASAFRSGKQGVAADGIRLYGVVR